MNGQNIFARNLRVVLTVALVALTGCQNGNLFGKLHDSGDSGNTDTLLADGSQALSNQDYANALSLYQRVLDKDPYNSQALYGAATAQVGLSGLNFGQLLANVLNKDGTISSSSLGDAITSHSVGSASVSVLTTSILRNLYTDALGQYLSGSIDNLKKIAAGQSDGKISQNDVAMLIDLGILSLIDAAYTAVRNGICDIVNDNGTLKVVTKTSAAAYCSDPANAETIRRLGFDLARSFYVLNRAASSSTSATSLLNRFKDDVYKVVNEGLDSDGNADIDSTCVAALASQGITASNFGTVDSL